MGKVICTGCGVAYAYARSCYVPFCPHCADDFYAIDRWPAGVQGGLANDAFGCDKHYYLSLELFTPHLDLQRPVLYPVFAGLLDLQAVGTESRRPTNGRPQSAEQRRTPAPTRR